MKNKSLLLKALTCLLLVPCFVIPFITMFVSNSIVGDTTSVTGEYGIFADFTKLGDAFSAPGYNKELATFWMVLVSISVVVLAVLALAYIVMFVLDLLKVKVNNLPKLTKFVGVAILVCSVVALISAIIAVSVNSVFDDSKF